MRLESERYTVKHIMRTPTGTTAATCASASNAIKSIAKSNILAITIATTTMAKS